MMEIIGVIFHSFWTFIGSIILIAVLGDFIHDVISSFVPVKHYHLNGKELNEEQVKIIEELNDKT